MPFPQRPAQDGGAALRLEPAFRACEPRLLRFLSLRLSDRGDAEDVAQLAFLRLWQRRQDLTETNLEALIFVTARNIATDMQRDGNRRRKLSSNAVIDWNEAAEVCDETQSPERATAALQHLNLIPQLLEELPPKCKTAFLGFKFEGLSYGELAEQLNVSESMVRKYVLKALAHCVSRFERLEGWE